MLQSCQLRRGCRDARIVQSAMSNAIARLEQDLRAPLFDRTVSPIALTEQGATLQTGAQRSLMPSRQPTTTIAAVSGQIRVSTAKYVTY